MQDRAILDGEKEGTDHGLGATLVTQHAGEMVSRLTLAITAGVGLGTIASTIHCHPTQESLARPPPLPRASWCNASAVIRDRTHG